MIPLENLMMNINQYFRNMMKFHKLKKEYKLKMER